jgi:hypothetical protein
VKRPIQARPEPVTQDEILDEIDRLNHELKTNIALQGAIKQRIKELKGKLK